jgi:lipoprotein NlpD
MECGVPGRGGLILGCLLLFGCGSGQTLAPVHDASDSAARQPSAFVTAGDTLYAFAWRYGFDYRDLARWNGLRPPYTLIPGQRLRLGPGASVPGQQVAQQAAPESAPEPSGSARSSASVQPRTAPPSAAGGTRQSTSNSRPAPRAKPKTPPAGTDRAATSGQPDSTRAGVESGSGSPAWSWPAEGRVARGFEPGRSGGNGIDIVGGTGGSVRAAGDGKVVYQGSGLPGYGRLIIVKHSESLLSAYGYLGKAYVAEGDFVRGGQQIADLGMGGGYNKPVVHFEIRRNGQPKDPLAYLPKRA